jgi:hypothetical protein
VLTIVGVMRLCTTLLFLAGCGFSTHAGAPDAPIGPVVDAAVADAAADAPAGDAAVCVPGVVDVCGMPAPTMAFDVSNAAPLNTDSDGRCTTVTLAGHAICLIYATEVTIASTGSLMVTGGRPLALVSASTLRIDGAIDAGSHGPQIGPAADDTSCAFASIPDNDLGGAGGGAGGSFTLAGGNGGTGDTDSSLGGDGMGSPGTHGATVSAPPLRGGCPGQKGGDEQTGGFVGGTGGHAGGALYLAARVSVSVAVAGSIRATGAGGAGGRSQAGGGGGGSGGTVVIESPAMTISGKISANGGGGGQGGGRTAGGDNVTGGPGTDGALGTTPAPGGFGANNNDSNFSTGGAGGAGTTAAAPGTGSILGGGGGGGGAGMVRLIGTATLAGSTISPPPS